MGGAVVGDGVVVVAGVVEVVCGLSAARATGGKGLVTASEGGGEAAFCCCCARQPPMRAASVARARAATPAQPCGGARSNDDVLF